MLVAKVRASRHASTLHRECIPWQADDSTVLGPGAQPLRRKASVPVWSYFPPCWQLLGLGARNCRSVRSERSGCGVAVQLWRCTSAQPKVWRRHALRYRRWRHRKHRGPSCSNPVAPSRASYVLSPQSIFSLYSWSPIGKDPVLVKQTEELLIVSAS